MGRLKIGDFIRQIDYINAKEDGDQEEGEETIHNQFVDFEGEIDDDATFEELVDGYKAFMEKCCVPGIGYRHSPAYYGAYSTTHVLDRMRTEFDDESEAKHREIGRLEMECWLGLLRAGASSGHVELMSRFIDTCTENYLQSCKKAELANIFEKMKIQFSFDFDDTDVDEQTYSSMLSDQIRGLFKDISAEKLQLAHEEFLDLYLHYIKQLPTLTEELQTYVGYIVRDMPDRMRYKQADGKESRFANCYVGCKTETLKTHIQALKEILVTCGDNIFKLEDIFGRIVSATMNDKQLEPVFDSLMDICVKLAERKPQTKGYEKIYDVIAFKLYRYLKETMVPTSSMFDTCLNSLKSMMGHVQADLGEKYRVLIEDATNEGLGSYPKMTPEQTKSFLDYVNTLLLSGHQRLVNLAERIMRNENMEKKLIWRKFLDEVKVFFRTVSKQPYEKMYSEDKRDRDVGSVVNEYQSFMNYLFKVLAESNVLTKLCPDLLQYVFTCIEEYPEHKAYLAYEATDKKRFIIKNPESGFLEEILTRCGNIAKNDDLPWGRRMKGTVQKLLDLVIAAYDGDGRLVTPEQHAGFMSIFKTALAGNDIDDTFYPPGLEKDGGIKLVLFRTVISSYISLHLETATQACCVGLLSDVLKWARIAEEQDFEDILEYSLSIVQMFSSNPPRELANALPQIMNLFVNPIHMGNLLSLVQKLYPMNPEPVHNRLQKVLDNFDKLKEAEKGYVTSLLSTVATAHPERITEKELSFIFGRCPKATKDQQYTYLSILYPVSRRSPEKLQPFFSKLLDDKLFHSDSLSFRIHIIACTAGRNEKLTHQAIDYFMRLASHKNPDLVLIGLSQLAYMEKDHKDYMQKHKASLQHIAKTATVPENRQSANNLIQVLEGKNYQDVFKDLQEQRELIAELDEKLGLTIDTVITMGEHVTEHHHQIKEVQKDIGDLDEKVDEIDEDLGETKIKVEEIDNKTMTNAPKWSRDLTKLMNPKHEADWRLLAQRLAYSNDDIRAWSQQHDPCMALLSEWYATHKTSEANFGVLTALTEMNRLDGAAIVENAMKASEDVVEDEEFEYPSPPPVFLSYQWGMQEEVKLLKQHLNMAGYECWMDIGQMGGGDKLFAKIDNGIRAAKVIICCVTEKYAQSPNCNREVNLSVNLGKPMYPLLMEKMAWPPKGSMGPIFSEYLFIRFFQRAGEETKDNRYWPVPKFQELLMQLNYNVAPDEALIKKEYKKWWIPIVEEIVIDKTKGSSKQVTSTSQPDDDSGESPVVFLSYQWGKQPQVKTLFQRIRSLGYTVWMDIFQMGGGDSLYDKIDRGVRGCKVIVSCVTPKYALSANCRREVSLADAIKKPIIPLLLEQMKWPPDGPMSMVFTELLYINVYRDPDVQTKWTGEKFDELAMKLEQYVGGVKDSKVTTQAGQKENNSARKENNSGKKEGKEAQVVAKMMEHVKAERGKASESKSKADGSASQNKFVEPTTKAAKPPPKSTKQPTATVPTQKADNKAKPQKDAERVNYASAPQTKESTLTAESKPQTSAPKSNNQRPASNSQRPASNSQRPASNSQRPTSNSQRPASNSQRSTSNSQKPASNSQKPASNSQKPASDSQKPAPNSQKQAPNNQKPAESAEAPKSSSCVVL